VSCRNAERVNELIRLTGVRHLPYRNEPRPGGGDTILREGGQHRLAYSPFRPMILHGDEPTASWSRLFFLRHRFRHKLKRGVISFTKKFF
jgi:hypothetical protein